MRDAYDDEIRVVVNELGGSFPAVAVSCHDSEGDLARAVLTPKKARKLAKKLLAAADEIDGVKPVEPHGAREIEDRLAALEEHNAVEYRALKALDPWGRIKALEAEQHWDREQITALLAVLGAQREREAEEGDGNATPVDDEIHYLLPRSWILENTRSLNTSEAGSVTFEIPAGTHLRDRVSTGFAP